MSLLDRVTVDPAVCHGAPTLRGLRYPVEMIVRGRDTRRILGSFTAPGIRCVPGDRQKVLKAASEMPIAVSYGKGQGIR